MKLVCDAASDLSELVHARSVIGGLVPQSPAGSGAAVAAGHRLSDGPSAEAPRIQQRLPAVSGHHLWSVLLCTHVLKCCRLPHQLEVKEIKLLMEISAQLFSWWFRPPGGSDGVYLQLPVSASKRWKQTEFNFRAEVPCVYCRDEVLFVFRNK